MQKERNESTPGPKPFIPTEADIVKAEDIAAQAFSYGAIASKFGFSVDTLSRVRKECPEFAEALKRGKLKAVAGVEYSLLKCALKGQPAAMIFFLKNHAGWSDKQEVEHSGSIDGVVKVEIILPDNGRGDGPKTKSAAGAAD
jgi:hypothetical protein